MAKQVWKINDWSGGYSDSPEIGIKNSFTYGQGLDIHSEPKVLKVLQKLTKESGVSPNVDVTDLIKTAVACSDGNTYLFGDGGKIYKRTSAGVLTLKYTDANGAILGSGEHNGYIYWATASKLSRKPIPGQADWSDVVHDWKSLTADSDYHPITVCWEELYVGCKNDLASVDISGTFTSSALDLPPEERIRCLSPASSYIVLHTWKGNTINEGRIFTWDSLGSSYLTVSETAEVGVRASLFLKNFLYIWAGISGNFYYFDSQQLQLLKRLPGTYTSAIFSEVFPEAITVRDSSVLFGMSAGAGAATKLGVYGWGQYNKNYPLVLTYDYPISTGTTTSIKVGIVKQIGNTLLVSWKDGVTITMTIANPCVVSWAAHGQSNGTPIMFTTTGALPTGITVSVYYYIRIIDANTFNLYDTAAHAIAGGSTGRIITSGTQSGVHTGANYGVDKLDETAKQTIGICESVIFDNEEPFRKKRASKFTLKFRKLPADCSFKVKYRRDYETTGGDASDGWINVGTVGESDGAGGWTNEGDIVAHLEKVFEFYNVQIRLELNTNANVTPELISAFMEFENVPYGFRK